MANSDVAALLGLAADQHGLVSRSQALAAGISDAQLTALKGAGVVATAGRGIVRVVGVPRSWEQRISGALLRSGAGTAASHGAAARLWELEGFERATAEISVPHGRHVTLDGVLVHHSTDLAEASLLRRSGLRVTDVTRTIADLGAVVESEALEVALDDALRRRLTTVPRLQDAVARWGRRGRSGVGTLRSVLAARDLVDDLTDTGFERRLLRILREAGLPTPSTQHRLHDGQGLFVMRFDAAYVDVRLGIEADSERWHMDRRRFVADRTKRACAESLGWHVLALTHHHVSRDRGFVADVVGRTLERLGCAA